MGNSSSSSSGVGFLGLLTVAFIVLKLINVITWSWVWVLAPLWGGLVASILVLGIMFLIAVYVGKRRGQSFKNKIKKMKNNW